jgi:hypothetical protein
MPTTITSAGVTFNDTTSLTSATLVANSVGTTQITNGSVTAAKLGTTEQKQICKAWVNFDGTLSTPITPRASYNVSSVTKSGAGDYTITFTTAMADANYSAVGTARMNGTIGTSADSRVLQTRTFATGTLQVYCTNGPSNDGSDSNIICVQVFGN